MELSLPVEKAGFARTIKKFKSKQKQSGNRHRNGWWDVWQIPC